MSETIDRVICGDCIDVLRTLDAESVHCCVTSPPYWGLRSYISEGEEQKQHELGLEETPDAYVARMVDVFREVRRVLRDDGTCWVNLGDSFASNFSGGKGRKAGTVPYNAINDEDKPARTMPPGLKPKDLVGIPWRVAFALQADGWWLRSDIVWAKPNPMPESVRDRPTCAHEYLFLLTKSARYFFDQEAVREAHKIAYSADGKSVGGRPCKSAPPGTSGNPGAFNDGYTQNAQFPANPSGRNIRSVWTVATKPFSAKKHGFEDVDHFATYPPALIEPCVKAGTSERGACPACGAPHERVVEKRATLEQGRRSLGYGVSTDAGGDTTNGHGGSTLHHDVTSHTLDWRPTCDCDAGEPVPCRVLDPFFGAGTTGVVAATLGRSYTGIELNPQYVEIAEQRIADALAGGPESLAARVAYQQQEIQGQQAMDLFEEPDGSAREPCEEPGTR